MVSIKNIAPIFRIVTTLVLSTLQLTTFSQESMLHQLPDDEQNAIEAIALYPEKERTIILEAASHPEILVRIQNIKKNTEEKFKVLLESLPEEDQKKIFNLSRYPNLIEKISQEKLSNEELKIQITGYPKEIREQTIFANQKYFQLLTDIHQLYQSSELIFETVLKNYSPTTRQAYKELLKLPEIISILAENMSTTVLLGDLYKNNPQQLKKQLDSLNVVVAEQNAKELNEWKQDLEENPEAMQEYEQVAKEFAYEQGVNESEYNTYVPEENKTEVEIRYVYQPYPYWFGYPWWYNYEYWYPYPYWYHWGYYYGLANIIVFYGLPSNYFMYWHFHHQHHFYHYPHFTNHVVNYYYGHRKSKSSISTVVKNWEKEIRFEVPNNFLANDKNRANRIKEYGKLKMDYQSTIQKANGKVPNQMEYLKKNARKYPAINSVLEEKQTNYIQAPIKEKNIPTKEYNVPKYEPKEKVIKDNRSNYQDMDRAKKYHQNSWEKPIPKYQTFPKQTIPRQKTQEQKVPQKKAPSRRNR